MRDPQGKTVEDMFPSLFKEEDMGQPISEEDAAKLQAEMDAINNMIQKGETQL